MAAEPEEGEQKSRRCQPCGELRLAHGVEGVALESREPGRKTCHDAEGQEDGDSAHMGHDEIEERGPSVLDMFVLKEDQKVRGRSHQFPGDQKEQGVVSQDDQLHPDEEQTHKRPPGW